MTDYKKLYFQLFGCISTALEQLEQRNYGIAQTLLLQALTKAEDTYLEEDDDAETISV